MFEKIKNNIKTKQKTYLFLLIFALVSCFYNLNTQEVNYIFKKGSILEYSYSQPTELYEKKLERKLADWGIKYSFLNFYEYDKDEQVLDFENEKIKNKLVIAIPYILNENKTELVQKVSDYIFENAPNAKLIDIKSIENQYHIPFRAFCVFLNLIFISSLIWLLCLYLMYDYKQLIANFQENIKKFIATKKENLSNFIKKTKEKGIGYFLKRILFDNVTDENEKDVKFEVEIVKTIIFVIFCVIIIRYFIGELRYIPSGSMRPVILEKDRVFVEKLNFPYKKEIKRGDILVFYPPETKLSNSFMAILSRLSGIWCKDIAYIKRLVALPGEKFEIKQNKLGEYKVYINDKPLYEPYINSKTDWIPCQNDMYCGPFIVPQGHYFMMGDNRGNSQDSRFWGFLDENRIIGRANFMFYPLSRINFLKDKYLELNKNKNEKHKYLINRY